MHEDRTSSEPPSIRYVGWRGSLVIGIYLVILSAILVYLLYTAWPTVTLDEQGNKVRDDQGDLIWEQEVTVFWSNRKFPIRDEARLILLVMIAGALGSYVHGATSFASYVGNRRLEMSWIWWYLLRTPIGVSLALIVYFVLRGGLLSAGATAGDISPFGIVAVGGLVGMFSKQATDKLRETFDNLFRTEKGDQREGKLVNPKPAVTAIEPPRVKVGSNEVIIQVTGSHFIKGSVVRVNGSKRDTKFVNADELAADLLTSDVATTKVLTVTVFNPPPEGGISNPLPLTVE